MRCGWCSNPEGLYSEGVLTDTDEMMAFIESCRPMFFDGGGLTLTGGEPTMQFDGVDCLLRRLRDAGIHTAMETNGTHEKLPMLFDCTDYLIMDCKHYDSAVHRAFTHAGNETVFQNVRAAASVGKALHIRIPLIDGFNASEQHAYGFIDRFREVDTSSFDFEFLEYHELGKGKWEKIGLEYPMPPSFVDRGITEAFISAFTRAGLKVIQS